MIRIGLFSLAILAFARTATVTKYDLPDYGIMCHRSDPNLNTCIRDLLQEGLLHAPEMGEDSIEAIFVDEVSGEFKGAGYDFNHQLKNMTVRGLSKTKVLAVRADLTDPKDLKIELDTSVPEVRMKGHYKVDGVFASLKVRGRGPFTTNASDVISTVKVRAHLYDKDGVKYMKVHRVDVAPKIGKLKFYFSNIIDGNRELSDSVNKLLNDLWQPAYQGMLPYMMDMFDKVSKRLVNRVLSKVPYDILIPE